MSKISDIAKTVGVSTATVSRAFNQHPYVNEALRKKILEVGQKMNYAPTISSLRRNFGIVFGNFKFGYYQRHLLYHLTNGILAKGYNLQIVNSNQLPFIHKNTYCGMFLLSNFSRMEELQKLGIPLMFVNYALDGFYSVTTDHKLSMEIAVSHLIKHGHRKIAFVRAKKGHWGSDLREKGYRETLSKYNIAFDPKLLAFYYKPDDIEKRLLKLVSAKATAVVVDGEENTPAVNYFLNKNHIRVPDDLSVICFEDEEHSQYTNPPYTAVKQDFGALGMVAASIMLQLISQKKNLQIATNTVIPGNSLVIRESVRTISDISS